MWVEIICGFIFYRLFRRFFYGSDDVLGLETSDFNAIFSVANREAAVISVKNLAGFVSVNEDGSWTTDGGSTRAVCHPDPVSHHVYICFFRNSMYVVCLGL
ncbi:Plasma membrane isoform 1 [Hibiscus syriacus]|uniref:Plasma membrane isoform 1 n=1 Tax=Hibiscus syriacus TaxID=106335 RepID=A0A6A2WJC8_HIBSY|nr:Plasma membrane isoform 1 [Hibiscus syriacus]